jgi:transcriptional regulator with XRE-family HTH domain
MMVQTTTEHARERVKALQDARRFRQKAVAKRLNMSASNVSRTINDESRDFTLAFLDAVAHEARVPLVELVVPPDSMVRQLNADEARLLRAMQGWPASVTRSLLQFVAFFADEPPVAQQTRNVHEYWRGMDQIDRDWIYGLLVMLREGKMPQDLRTGLLDHLKREQYKRQSDDAKRRRKEA